MAASSVVDRILAAGRAAFPEITAADARLVPLIHQRLEDEAAPAELAGDEIFLACACALAVPAALTAFERRYFGVIAPALARLSLQRDEIAEVEQVLRVRLFVSEAGESPRVVTYAGPGQLGGLVRVAAIRAGLDLLRQRGRLELNPDGLEELPVAGDDPELAGIKAQHRAEFKAAFEDAVAGLEARERSLLDLAIVKGLGIDRVGAIYGVHRATAARWIEKARGNLARAVHHRLGARLGVRPGELDDLLPLVESQLELSLERLLRATT